MIEPLVSPQESPHGKNGAVPLSQKPPSWPMFDRIARCYDLLNRVLSFGLDQRWRHEVVASLDDLTNQRVLDLACGTGDITFQLAQDKRVSCVMGCDPAMNMLAIARIKEKQKSWPCSIYFVRADALSLPFKSETFDAVTVGFGIRNMGSIAFALREIRRVLKPKGRAVILEFSQPDRLLLRLGHRCYLALFVPFLGGLLSGDFRAYRYLSRTILSFPYGETFERIMVQCGLKPLPAKPLLGGTATIYIGLKASSGE